MSGRIVDDLGEPRPEIIVTALRLAQAGPSPRLLETGLSAETDDRGEYRLWGLPPGSYYVSAHGGGTWRSGNRILPLGDLYQTITPSHGSTVYRYGRRFYPGSPDVGQAHALHLAEGEEVAGVDLSLLLARVASIEGTVTDSRGAPASGTLTIARLGHPTGSHSMATDLRSGGWFSARLDEGSLCLSVPLRPL